MKFSFTFLLINFSRNNMIFFHSLIYSRRLHEFDNQFALINDITYVAKIILIFENHIERFFLYVIELN